jgi:hypothetical protein
MSIRDKFVNCLGGVLSRLKNDEITTQRLIILFFRIMEKENINEYNAMNYICEKLQIKTHINDKEEFSILCEQDNEQLNVNLIILLTNIFPPRCTSWFPNFQELLGDGKFNDTELRL